MNIAYIGPGAGALLALTPYFLIAVVVILIVAAVVLAILRRRPDPSRATGAAVQQADAMDDASRRR